MPSGASSIRGRCASSPATMLKPSSRVRHDRELHALVAHEAAEPESAVVIERAIRSFEPEHRCDEIGVGPQRPPQAGVPLLGARRGQHFAGVLRKAGRRTAVLEPARVRGIRAQAVVEREGKRSGTHPRALLDRIRFAAQPGGHFTPIVGTLHAQLQLQALAPRELQHRPRCQLAYRLAIVRTGVENGLGQRRNRFTRLVRRFHRVGLGWRPHVHVASAKAEQQVRPPVGRDPELALGLQLSGPRAVVPFRIQDRPEHAVARFRDGVQVLEDLPLAQPLGTEHAEFQVPVREPGLIDDQAVVAFLAGVTRPGLSQVRAAWDARRSPRTARVIRERALVVLVDGPRLRTRSRAAPTRRPRSGSGTIRTSGRRRRAARSRPDTGSGPRRAPLPRSRRPSSRRRGTASRRRRRRPQH